MTTTNPVAESATVAPREGWVDVFRGLLITHMALDHTSLMFNAGRGAEELAAAPPGFPASLPQFLTRFTGVPVAPGFFLMAGFMVAWTTLGREARGVPPAEITRRLLVRGFVLIAADTLIGGLPRMLQGFYSFVVLSCIGVSIIALAFLRRLPNAVLLSMALAMLALHPLLDLSGLPVPLRAVLHEPVREGAFRSLYPVIPWLGMVMLGFVVGRKAATQEPVERERFWIGLGLASLAAFFVVRFSGYGNAFGHHGITSREFWYFSKYPPDLPFSTWAFACVFFALALVHRICRPKVPEPLHPFVVFGRVSFFFYLVHFYLLAPVRGILGALLKTKFGLPETYVVWLALLVVMFFLCGRYYEKKRLRPNFVTRYL